MGELQVEKRRTRWPGRGGEAWYAAICALFAQGFLVALCVIEYQKNQSVVAAFGYAFLAGLAGLFLLLVLAYLVVTELRHRRILRPDGGRPKVEEADAATTARVHATLDRQRR